MILRRITRISIRVLLLTFSVLFLFSENPVVHADSDPLFKVGLLHGKNAVSEISVSAASQLAIAEISGESLIIKENLNTDSVFVKNTDGAISIFDLNSTLLRENLSTGEAIVSVNFQSGEPISIASKMYRGGVGFFPVADKMNVINVINLENYLYGVIHAEIGKSSPPETLKAQAVTARSYVMANPHRHTKDGFDICTSVHCQTYRGFKDEYPETIAAVDATAGVVMRYNGKIVQGFYSKNSGGHTENSKDIWGGNAGYLKGVPDEYSPEYPWTYELNLSDFSNSLLKNGHIVGRINEINIVNRFSSGSVSSVEIKGDGGRTVISSNSFRNMIGASKLKSLMFTVNAKAVTHRQSDFRQNAASSTPPLQPDSNEFSGDGYAFKQMKDCSVISFYSDSAPLSEAYVIDSQSRPIQLNPTDRVYVISKPVNIAAAPNPSIPAVPGYGAIVQSNENFVVPIGADSAFLCGVGWGHGIGMPQDSAIVMGKKGMSFQEILNYFYSGIELGRI